MPTNQAVQVTTADDREIVTDGHTGERHGAGQSAARARGRQHDDGESGEHSRNRQPSPRPAVERPVEAVERPLEEPGSRPGRRNLLDGPLGGVGRADLVAEITLESHARDANSTSGPLYGLSAAADAHRHTRAVRSSA